MRAMLLNPSEEHRTTAAWVASHNEHRDALLNENPVRVAFSADLNPLGIAAVCRLLNAIQEGREVLLVTDGDLIRAVVELAGHDSPSSGGSDVAPSVAGEPSVGVASGAWLPSSAAPEAPNAGAAS